LVKYRWDKETFDAAKKDNEQQQAALRPDAKTKPSQERVSIAEQARALLDGRERWKGRGDEARERVWEDVGEAVEVEADVQLPKE
jgi:large subunit ribosomal protein L23